MRSRQVLASAAKWFTSIYDENLLGCNSEPISVRFLHSIVINLPELHDFMVLLRSNGN